MDANLRLPTGCEPACHGCRHRSLDAAASLAQKREYLIRCLGRWAGRIAPVAGVAEPRRLGYRDKSTLTARWSAAEGWRFGLVRRDELIAIHDCPVHSARIRALVGLLVRSLPPATVLPTAYLHVAGAQATLIVKTKAAAPAGLDVLLHGLPATGLEGLWLHHHPSAGRRLFARSGWTLLWGTPESTDREGLRHGPTAFQQLVPELHATALDGADIHLRPAAGDAVLDLYCGSGATLRRWLSRGASALGVELSGEALRFAAVNAPGANLLRGTCSQRLPQIEAWWSTRPAARLVYANPPRSGLEPDVLEALGRRLRPERLAYLSCSAGTLARDLASLELAGYAIDSLQPFDFFPQTHHVEVLALLERR